MNLNWKKYNFKIAALLILLVFIFGVTGYILPSLRGKESYLIIPEKMAIRHVEGFTNGTLILTVKYISGSSDQISGAILKDTQGNTIEVIDSIHEEISVDEEIQVSVTFNSKNLQLSSDYMAILCSEKGGCWASYSFKFSNTN